VHHTQEHRPDARTKDQGKVQVFLEENQGTFSVFPSTSGCSVINLVQEIQNMSSSCDSKPNSYCLYSGSWHACLFFFLISDMFSIVCFSISFMDHVQSTCNNSIKKTVSFSQVTRRTRTSI